MDSKVFFLLCLATVSLAWVTPNDECGPHAEYLTCGKCQPTCEEPFRSAKLVATRQVATASTPLSSTTATASFPSTVPSTRRTPRFLLRSLQSAVLMPPTWKPEPVRQPARNRTSPFALKLAAIPAATATSTTSSTGANAFLPPSVLNAPRTKSTWIVANASAPAPLRSLSLAKLAKNLVVTALSFRPPQRKTHQS
ncbi:hypothetical protein L596_020677 [Steinernema carpocapsae]|uniref:ShKT domain-containing protein n=1 Tax=Steinernema carpocapsae TaxID=34508 RepID=A0A4U5MUB4_STECR|nr:hypothetical protein L596_020677 [Steinernema carpocapsae]